MREGWTEVCIGDTVVISTDRLGEAPEPIILTCTEGRGLIDQASRFGKRLATEDTSAYKVVFPLDIVINPYLLWAGAIGQLTTGEAGITSPVYVVLRPNAYVDPRFIGLALTAPSMIRRYAGISIGSIERRRRVQVEYLMDLPLALPPLDEQRRIVDLIGSLDAAITTADDAVAKAEQARRAVLTHLLASPLRAAHSIATAGPVRSAPHGEWHKTSLMDVVAMVRRGRAPAYCEVSGLSVIGQKCIRDGTVDLAIARRTNPEARPVPDWAHTQPGDTLVNSTGTGTVGRVAFIPAAHQPACVDSHVTIVRPDSAAIEPAFLFLTLRRAESQLAMLASGSTNQVELSRETILAFPLAVPPREEQRRIVDIVSTIDDDLAALKATATAGRAARSAILADLISGAHEIPVSYDRLLEAT